MPQKLAPSTLKAQELTTLLQGHTQAHNLLAQGVGQCTNRTFGEDEVSTGLF
jgi:hypothetical protein